MGTNLAYIRATCRTSRVLVDGRDGGCGMGRRRGRDVRGRRVPRGASAGTTARHVVDLGGAVPRDASGRDTMASPGRVLIIVENLPVPFDRRVWMEVSRSHRAGYEVSVISPKGAGARPTSRPLRACTSIVTTCRSKGGLAAATSWSTRRPVA